MSLLIDVDSIIIPRDVPSLKEMIQPIPENDGRHVGIVLVVSQYQIDKMKENNSIEERIKYLDDNRFLSKITEYSYVLFDKLKKECEIGKVSGSKMLAKVVENTMRYLPHDVTLKCLVGAEKVQIFTDNGFSIREIKGGLNLMERKNDMQYEIPIRDMSNKNEFHLINQSGNVCTFSAQLSEGCIKYMKGLPTRGVTLNHDNSVSQKEIIGHMKVTSITDNLVNVIDVEIGTIARGGEENVSIEPSQITFHSHPAEAYKRHNVKLGGPSATDYSTFLSTRNDNNLIMHIVVSIEGFYVVSCSQKWILSDQTVTDEMHESFVKIMKIVRFEGETPYTHVAEINSIEVDGVTPLVVEFIPWSNAGKIFSVNYNKEANKCGIPV